MSERTDRWVNGATIPFKVITPIALIVVSVMFNQFIGSQNRMRASIEKMELALTNHLTGDVKKIVSRLTGIETELKIRFGGTQPQGGAR